jgi:alanine dehydrogenase
MVIIGIPKEIKNHEYRVGMTPAGVGVLTGDGHELLVESGAGLGSGFTDEEYRQAGGRLVEVEELFARAQTLVKVKEPLPQEVERLRPEQTLFTYLHLAAVPALAQALLEREITAIAYETVQLADGSLPLLQPMSLIAGRMAVQVGASYLQKEHGGRGVLLSGAPGVQPGKVVVLGGGTVGANAVRIAVGMGAEVTVFDIDAARLAALDAHYVGRVRTLTAHPAHIEEQVRQADLCIGAVLVAGDRAPQLVNRQTVAAMAAGSVIVDVAVDQGGCVETIRPTTHEQPVYSVDGVLHYGVTNMPGAVSRTSTFALTDRTLPYLRRLASRGWQEALRADPALAAGLNTAGGRMRHAAVAHALGRPFQPYSG